MQVDNYIIIIFKDPHLILFIFHMELQKYLYESLLDDEEDLINNDENVKEIIFYEELQSMLPGHGIDRIKQECKYNNGKAKLDSTFSISSKNRTPDEYGNNIFKGFSTCSKIEYIRSIDILKYYDTKKIDPNKYSISKVNKYPMNIKKLMRFDIYSPHLLDYCRNINIDYIDHVFFAINDDFPELNTSQFDFFKNVKNIELVSFNNFNNPAQIMNNKGSLIHTGVIRNINANTIIIPIANIIHGIMDKTDLNNENKQIFYDFIDDLYKYNNLNKIIISIQNSRSFREKRYIVEKGKTKANKYLLRILK